jgi:hypothetical protein
MFSVQTATAADTFSRSTQATFSRIFDLARVTSQANQLATRTLSSFDIIHTTDPRIVFIGKITSYFYPGHDQNSDGVCYCMSEPSVCGHRIPANDTQFESDTLFLAGLVVRCLPTETVLNSTRECWYDRSCYESIIATDIAMGAPGVIDTGPLEDVSSRFPKNASMESMMIELLLESCTINFSYERFYQGCVPMSCIYTVEHRFEWLYVILIILSVYSGLS